MLHEVAAGDLDPATIVNPVRKLLRRVSCYEAKALKIDLHNKTVTVEHGFDEHTHELRYDQIVLALGSPELAVTGWPGVWALGDCALIPDLTTGSFCPPTAQHALRLAHAEGRQLKQFRFKTIGQLASIGRRAGVASILGINISGFLAWWMWRTIYLSKLPRLEKKLRVALDWTLDLMFSKDLCRSLEVRGEKRKSL